jgi:flagellar biosynthetic protein FlhB
MLMAGMVVSLLAGLAQGGVNFAPEALSLKFDRFNPASRLGQIFSPMGLSNLLKSLLPFSAIMWITVSVVQEHWQSIVHASGLGLRMFATFVSSMVFELTWKAGLVLVGWSGIDYLFTWKKIEGDLKMSKQEVREEYKETDGNPAIKSRIRQLQRAMRKRKSLKAAATATVIVTNPTHYAVALRFETNMPAPLVVAKGQNQLAEKIKQMARENGIMLVENRPLAQALYKSVEVGDAIPSKLYQAVAEILAIVFRAEAEVRRGDVERRSRNASGQKAESRSTSSAPRPGVKQ